MERERRQITRTEDKGNVLWNRYESRKSSRFSGDGKYETKGRVYGIRGIYSLLSGLNFDFVLEDNISEDIKNYCENLREKYRQHQQTYR